MSETAGFGMDFLPPSVQRRQMVEDVREAREAREAERARADREDQAAERGREAFRAAAEARGEHVSVVALAQGQIGGRSLGDIFAGVEAAADREDARQGAAERNGRQDWGYVGRSEWPGSEFEASRMVSQAEQNHRDLVAYKARNGYRGAQDAARAKAGR